MTAGFPFEQCESDAATFINVKNSKSHLLLLRDRFSDSANNDGMRKTPSRRANERRDSTRVMDPGDGPFDVQPCRSTYSDLNRSA
jgi:hypothetical protein